MALPTSMDRESQPAAMHPPWEQKGWLELAASWVADQVRQTRTGWSHHGEVIHRTPWSAVVKFPYGGDAVFLKAITQPFRHEIPLTELLANEFPSISPALLASDIDNGWLLMRSGGQRLREAVEDREIVEHWLRLMPRYAGLQLELRDRSDQLLGMGVPDRRAARVAEQYGGLIDDAARQGSGTEQALSQWEVERLVALGSQIHSAVDRLSSSPIAETLEHGDLHDGNVFTDREAYSCFDWGDAGVSFPFFSLRTLEVSIENRLGEPSLLEARPALRGAYLRTWVDRAGLGWREAHDLLATAERVWSLAAALRWRRAIRALPAGEQAVYGHVLPSLLREVLQAHGNREVH